MLRLQQSKLHHQPRQRKCMMIPVCAALLIVGLVPKAYCQIQLPRVIKPDSVLPVGFGDSAYSVAVHPNGKMVGFSLSGQTPLKFFEIANWKMAFSLPSERSGIQCLAFSPDGKTFAATTAGTLAWNDATRVWDMNTRKVLHSLKSPPKQAATRLAYTPDSKYLATLETDNCVRMWDVNSGELVVTLTQQGEKKLSRLAISPDGKTLATSSFAGGILEVRDLQGPTPLKDLGKEKPRLSLQCTDKAVYQILFTPDSGTLIAVSKNLVQLWDVKTGKVRQELDRKNRESAKTAAVSPDGKLLVIGCESMHSELWDLESGKLRALLGPFSGLGANCMAFTPNGDQLIVGAFNGDGYLFKMPK